MKYAVISDIHSNIFGLKKALDDAKKKNIENFIFLGDFITDGIYDNEVLEIVKEYGNYCVSGNREQYLCGFMHNHNFYSDYNNEKPLFFSLNHLTDENKDYIDSLPKTQIITFPNYKILCIHGNSPFLDIHHRENLQKLMDAYSFDICLYGHLHEVQDFTYEGKRFLNPGSIGIPADGPFYSYGILTIDKDVQFEIVRFSTKEDFSKLQEEYQNSAYYKENSIWGDLILESIYTGKDVVEPFIKTVQSKLELCKQVDFKLYNTLWNEAYLLMKKKK